MKGISSNIADTYPKQLGKDKLTLANRMKPGPSFQLESDSVCATHLL